MGRESDFVSTQGRITSGPLDIDKAIVLYCIIYRQIPDTLSDKISADKIFGGQNFSAHKIFGTKSKFRQICLTKLFHWFPNSPYNFQEKYVLT